MPQFTPDHFKSAVEEFHQLPAGPAKEAARAALLRAAEAMDAGMPEEGPLDTIGKVALKSADLVPGVMRTAANEAFGPGEVTAESAADDWKRALLSIDPAYGRKDFRRRAGDNSEQPGADLAADMLYSPLPLNIANGLAGGLKQMLINRGYMAGPTAAALREVEKKAAEQAMKSGLRRTIEAAPGFMTDPLGNTVRAAGRKFYNMPFKAADIAAVEEGAKPVSDVMHASGVVLPAMGTSKSLAQQAKRLSRQASERVDDAISDNTLNRAANVPSHALVQDPVSYLMDRAEMGPISDQAKSVMDEMQSELAPHIQSPDMDVRTAHELKKVEQNLARKLRGYVDALDSGANTSSTAAAKEKIKAEMSGKAHALRAGNLRVAIEDSLDRAQKGLGGKVHQDNQVVQSLMHGEPVLQEAANQGLGATVKDMAVPVAGGLGVDMLGNAAQIHGPIPYMAAATGVAASLPIVQTTVGGLLSRYGAIPAAALRAKLLENANQPSPWQLLQSDLRKDLP
jgi:hypothetical protein